MVLEKEPSKSLDAAGGPIGGFDRQAIGTYLKRQRELRGIGIEELARTTRIPVRSLLRLEAGAYDGQSDGFVRGFVRTVAVALGLDPEDTVSRMLNEVMLDPEVTNPLSRGLGRAAAGAAAVVIIAVSFFLALQWFSEDEPPVAGRAGELILRRDAVRVLADAVASDAKPLPSQNVGAAIRVSAQTGNRSESASQRDTGVKKVP